MGRCPLFLFKFYIEYDVLKHTGGHRKVLMLACTVTRVCPHARCDDGKRVCIESRTMNKLHRISICFLIAVIILLTGCDGGYYLSRTIAFSSPKPNQLKVMTFNIRTRTILDGPNHWNHRKEAVSGTIAGNAADIVGLQEAKNSQLNYLTSTLPQYGAYAVGRSDGARGGESCPVLYRRDRFLLINSGTFWFSDTPSVPGSKDWGNMPPRICSWVHLKEIGTDNKLYVYNVHLDNLSQKSRTKSVELLADMIAVRPTEDPFVVMGDFNMEIQNPAMRWLNRIGIGKPRLANTDVWKSIHPNRSIGTRQGFDGRGSGPQIDHIRISSKLCALDARVDAHSWNGRYPSDHFPVVANIRLEGSRHSRSTAETPYVTNGTGSSTLISAGAL